jgi:hypothetical protein
MEFISRTLPDPQNPNSPNMPFKSVIHATKIIIDWHALQQGAADEHGLAELLRETIQFNSNATQAFGTYHDAP